MPFLVWHYYHKSLCAHPVDTIVAHLQPGNALRNTICSVWAESAYRVVPSIPETIPVIHDMAKSGILQTRCCFYQVEMIFLPDRFHSKFSFILAPRDNLIWYIEFLKKQLCLFIVVNDRKFHSLNPIVSDIRFLTLYP